MGRKLGAQVMSKKRWRQGLPELRTGETLRGAAEHLWYIGVSYTSILVS